MGDKRVAIIVPAYNEEKVVGGVIKELKKNYPRVIAVDDGSRDSTTSEILHAGAELVRHPINLGQGAALQTGIDYALNQPGIKYFVTFDSDGQHDPQDISRMLKILDSGKADIVLGSRFLGKVEKMPQAKRFILKSAILFSNKTSGVKLTDTHNGLRAFNRKFAESLELQNSDMTHASEIVDRIVLMNFRFQEAPVTIRYTEYSRSKGQPLSNAVNIGMDIILSRLVK